MTKRAIYHDPSEIATKVPTAQFEAIQVSYGRELVAVCYSPNVIENILVLMALITPTPAPLTMPVRRLCLAQGISPSLHKSSAMDIRYLSRLHDICPIGEFTVHFHWPFSRRFQFRFRWSFSLVLLTHPGGL